MEGEHLDRDIQNLLAMTRRGLAVFDSRASATVIVARARPARAAALSRPVAANRTAGLPMQSLADGMAIHGVPEAVANKRLA